MKTSNDPGVPNMFGGEGSPGPDFICVGAQKGGTRWLFDQLELRQDFWMPALKELRYFNWDLNAQQSSPSDPTARAESARKAKITKRKIASGSVEQGRRGLDGADVEWLNSYLWLSEQKFSLELYGKLFSPKGDRLSGDISPIYAIVDRSLALDVRKAFPNAKILYIARDPISRCWSQYCMALRRCQWSDGKKVSRFKKFFSADHPKDLSSVTRAVDTWRLSDDDENFKLFFFDDLVSRPEELQSEILAFLGASKIPAHASPEVPMDFNRKSNLAKIEMPEQVRDILLETFADEMRETAKRFGGPATGWLAKYGVA